MRITPCKPYSSSTFIFPRLLKLISPKTSHSLVRPTLTHKWAQFQSQSRLVLSRLFNLLMARSICFSKLFLVRSSRHVLHSILGFSTATANASLHSAEDPVKMAVDNRTYEQIPYILKSSGKNLNSQNPFSFLSGFAKSYRTRVIDEMLQSFIPLKPHARLKRTYHYLLLYTLQCSNPFPIALATLQRALRSSYAPVFQTCCVLSRVWIDQRREIQSVSIILQDMRSIGYRPDSGTCNFIINSLCNADQLEEAVDVLHGMVEACCVPDIDSYSSIIHGFCKMRKTDKAMALMKEMVGKMELSPRQETLVQLTRALLANKELWRAIEMIEYIERKGSRVGFQSYELVVEGCLKCEEFILAGKMAVMMADKGFIPLIKVRQDVVEGLVSIGEWQLACTVRHRFAELNS